MSKHSALMTILLSLLTASCAYAYDIGHVNREWYDAQRDVSVPVEVYYPATEAGVNTPIAIPPTGGFPVIAFAHGYLMPWHDYSYIWEALIPEGYIVLMLQSGDEILPNHEQYARDLVFVAWYLQIQGMLPESNWYNKISEMNAVMGHSMGGGASVLAASYDASIDAIVNLAASEVSPSAIDAAGLVDVPTLMIIGSNDCATPYAEHQGPMFDALQSNTRAIVSIEGGSHCQFNDYNLTCELGEVGCTDPTITREEQLSHVIQLTRPFLNYHLQGNATAWATFRQTLNTNIGLDYTMDTDIPPVLIDVRADDEPVWLGPAGGNILYELQLVNTVGIDVTGGIWTVARLPNNLLLGPLSYESISLGPYEASEQEWRNQDFPGPAPGGIYRLIFNLGEFPTTVIDSDRLIIIKETPIGNYVWPDTQFGTLMSGEADAITAHPVEFAISQAWPNPFNATTEFTVTLPDDGWLNLEVYDISGRLAATLTDQQWSAGTHTFSFDATGRAAGVYFVRAAMAGSVSQVRKVVLVK
jgi:pimeloyl-ACP methyl ester carboxylesterase